MALFRHLLLTIFCSTLVANQKSDFEVQVTHIVGDSFVSASGNEGEKPIPLALGDKFKRTSPFAILVAKGSYAEMTLQTESMLRIGQQSVIELRNPNHLKIFNGSALLLLSKQQSFKCRNKWNKYSTFRSGYLYAESPQGRNLKIIMLKDKPTYLCTSQTKLTSGSTCTGPSSVGLWTNHQCRPSPTLIDLSVGQ